MNGCQKPIKIEFCQNPGSDEMRAEGGPRFKTEIAAYCTTKYDENQSVYSPERPIIFITKAQTGRRKTV